MIGIRFDMEGQPGHEDLCMAFNTLMARRVRAALLGEGFDKDEASRLAESITFDLAVMFDQDGIAVNGKRFGLVLSFRDAAGQAVPIEGRFDLHDYAASVLEFDDYG